LQNVLTTVSPASPRADGGPGVLHTVITVPGSSGVTTGQLNYQEFTASNGTGVWVRNALSDNSSWSAWKKVSTLGTPPTWTGSTAYAAYERVILPTGGLGYMTAARTTGSTFDATERDFWTFLPGGHQEQIATGTTSWKAPVGISSLITLDLLAGAAGGNGGGSATGAVNQVGGTGGAAGERVVLRKIAVTPATSYTCAVGAGGTGGAGGAAAGNNAGTVGTKGGDTTFINGGTTYRAWGGNIGAQTAGNSTTTSAAGAAGGLGGGIISTAGIPGAGGHASSGIGIATYPQAGVVGGAGGAPASSATSKGGLGGGARTAPNVTINSVTAGGSATGDGGNGTTATELGCGGGGGGGGCAGGAGGAGGGGGNGTIVVEF
jgi:hypothetical protein